MSEYANVVQQIATANAGGLSRMHSRAMGPAWLRFTLDMNLDSSKRYLFLGRFVIAAFCVSAIVWMHIQAPRHERVHTFMSDLVSPWSSRLQLFGVLAMAGIAVTLLFAIIRHGSLFQRIMAVCLILFPVYYMGIYAVRFVLFYAD